MSIVGNFSKEVYFSRKSLDLTQEKAAEMLGISLRWYQKIENGKVLPGAELTLKIVAYFGIDGNKLKDKDSLIFDTTF